MMLAAWSSSFLSFFLLLSFLFFFFWIQADLDVEYYCHMSFNDGNISWNWYCQFHHHAYITERTYISLCGYNINRQCNRVELTEGLSWPKHLYVVSYFFCQMMSTYFCLLISDELYVIWGMCDFFFLCIHAIQFSSPYFSEGLRRL